MKKLFLLALALVCLVGCDASPWQKPNIVWIEVGANFNQYGNSRENIAADCQRVARMGFTHVVVEVRPTSGDALFKSRRVPELKAVALWKDGGLQYVPRTADFDYLQAFIEEGHAAGLKVFAGVNMMVGGYRCAAGTRGYLYDHPELRDWAAVDYDDRGLVNHLDDDRTQGGRFLDPANPQVQEYLLEMLEDIAAYKELDGIVMDRCRYDDYALDAGYTEVARAAFAQYLGHEPERWPVFSEPGHIFLDREPDALELSWLTFRCQVIHDFVAKAAKRVHAVRPSLRLGAYVGAWFSEYYRSGVNWTSPRYELAEKEPAYRWATPAYQATGFADHLDFMLLGAYCPAANVYGEEEKTTEGYAKLGCRRLYGDLPFATGPDIGNERGYENGGQAELLPQLAQVVKNEADGFFLFDLCHIRMFDYWDVRF